MRDRDDLVALPDAKGKKGKLNCFGPGRYADAILYFTVSREFRLKGLNLWTKNKSSRLQNALKSSIQIRRNRVDGPTSHH